MKKIIITQSNYIPWKGYFDSINQVDEFVIYDDMQYTKRDWRNRNKINTPQGLKWLSVPVEVKGKFFQQINETKIVDPNWGKSHWDTIKNNYSKAPFFEEYREQFEALYLDSNELLLSKVNEVFIRIINEILGINTVIKRSEEFSLVEGKTEKLVDICLKSGATDYYSGPAAKVYMDESLFDNAGINVHYFDYSGYPEYNHLHGDFEHGVTILDLLFCEGKNSINFMKSFI